MKNKPVLFILLVFLLNGLVFAQESKIKRQFGVLTEDGGFFADLKAADIEARGYKNLSVELFTDNELEITFMIDSSLSQERVLPQAKTVAQAFATPRSVA